jgi:hypothetical protein
MLTNNPLVIFFVETTTFFLAGIGTQDERKVSSTILLSSFQINNMTASGLICPRQFYACCPTLQLVVFYDVPPLDNGASTSTALWVMVRKETSWMCFHLMAKR